MKKQNGKSCAREIDYAAQIDKALRQYEDCADYRPTKQYPVSWICNRISWCWKFRKITERQMDEFCDRAVAAMKNYPENY